MYTPLVVSALTLAASAARRRRPAPAARIAPATRSMPSAALTGVVGTGFHVYNVSKRPGGFAWQNLFYGAPLGAPMAILLAGLLGFARRARARQPRPARRRRIFGLPAGRALAALDRRRPARHGRRSRAAAFPRRLPQSVHVAAGHAAAGRAPRCSRAAALAAARRPRWLTRWWLRLTALLGFAGVGFHAYGVARNMGGWRNWSQNILNGPPLPAPPSFTGLALAGLAALRCWRTIPMTDTRRGRYPGYDVLAKRDTPSWNEQTRRSSTRAWRCRAQPRFFTAAECATLTAIAAASCRSRRTAPPIPVAALVDRQVARRPRRTATACAGMPRDARGLAARPARARCRGAARHRWRRFRTSARDRSRTRCCGACSSGELRDAGLGRHAADDLLQAAHAARHRAAPTTPIRPPGARSASAARPVRAAMCAWISTERDPWEAAEAKAGDEADARRGRTAMSDDPLASSARAPTAARRMCSVPAAGCRCANTARTKRSISPSSAPAPAAARSPASSPSTASRSSRFDAGPYLRPLEDFASDECEQTKLYWTDERIVDGDNPLQLGSNNSGKAVGGSTVHFAMVSLRFRPEWFKSRSLLGYGADWPLDWREMWHYYARGRAGAEDRRPGHTIPGGRSGRAIRIARIELNAAAHVLARRLRGARHRLDRDAARDPLRAARRWRILASIAASARSAAPPTPSRARWSPGSRARSRPARRSATSRWSGGSRWTTHGRATGVHYHREGHGASSARATSSSPAMRSRRRGCC